MFYSTLLKRILMMSYRRPTIMMMFIVIFLQGCSDGKMLQVSKNEQDRNNLTWLEVSAIIDVPANNVWELVAVNFDKNSLFTPDLKKSYYLDKKPDFIGSIRTAVQTNGDSFDVKIIHYNVEKKFIEWELVRADGVETGVASYKLIAMGNKTKIIFKGGFKMQNFFMDWIASMMFPDGFKAIAAGIKLRSEKGIKLKEENVDKILGEYGDQIQVKML